MSENSEQLNPKLEKAIKENTLDGVFLAYGALIDYFDNDSEDFNYCLKVMKVDGVALEEFYICDNVEELEGVICKFKQIVNNYISIK